MATFEELKIATLLSHLIMTMSSSIEFMEAESSAQRLAIADARYLWSEVDRLKSVVHHLQQSERHAHDEQQRLKTYVASFVTQAQLEAALCAKMSFSNVASSIDRTRAELLDIITKKADIESVQAIQTTKLDISVYESSAWDLKRLRATLEENVHDLFAQFAHHIETQVNSKLSIDDFDRIFNPETNGQKAAIESAAQRIARINQQLEELEKYVQKDRVRQQELAEIQENVLNLTHEHNVSRNAIEHLGRDLQTATDRVRNVEQASVRKRDDLETMATRLREFHTNTESDLKRQHQASNTMRAEIDNLTQTSQQTTATLAQIQQFTQHTLLKGIDTRFKHMSDALDTTLDAARMQQQKFKQYMTQQLSKTTERISEADDRHAHLEGRMQKLEVVVQNVREDVAAVKGPLLTVAQNLKEENVAILAEIRRSQDESRDILIDYKGLLEKDTSPYIHPIPSARPPSSASRAVASAAAAANRKLRQQHIHALSTRIRDTPSNNNNESSDRVLTRPQTTHGRIGTSPTSRLQTKATCSSPSSASTHITSPLPPRPKSESGSRPRKNLLSTIAAAGGTSTDLHELFVFPSTTDETIVTSLEPQES